MELNTEWQVNNWRIYATLQNYFWVIHKDGTEAQPYRSVTFGKDWGEFIEGELGGPDVKAEWMKDIERAIRNRIIF